MVRPLSFIVLFVAATCSLLADDGQWGQFRARKEWEDHRQSMRNLDSHYRYDPNSRGSPVNLEPLRNQLTQWAERVDEERRQRAVDRENRAHAFVEAFREMRRQAEEQARLATLAKWTALKQQAANGDIESSYRVARLIRWGEERLPREQKTGEESAKPWYVFAADKGHADAAYELAWMSQKSSPSAALRYFTKAAEAGKVEAVLLAADLAAEGIRGQLPPNPAEALRLYRIGVRADYAPALTLGAYLLLREPQLSDKAMTETISWLERAADREPAAAAKLAALRLTDQPGFPAELARAVALAKQALQSKSPQPEALLVLGLAKIDGLGGEAVAAEAGAALLRQAATLGSVRACYALALAYHGGLGGLTRSDTEAVHWRLEGAKLGHVGSMLELALRYRTGQGVERNAAESVRWLRTAADLGSVSAMMELAGLVIAKDANVSLDAPQIRAWAERAAHDGGVEAQELFGSMLLDGFGGPKDGVQALRWFRQAAEAGGKSGQFFYAQHLLEGIETPQDVAGAYRWMKRSAENGHADACAFLAWHHATGTGCEQDVVTARDWARRGAKRGSVMAQRAYGSYLGDGVGGPVDGPEAIRQLTLAVEQNDGRARLQLADYLRQGLPGVPTDTAAARKHYEVAAQSKDASIATPAKTALAQFSEAKSVKLDGLRINSAPAKTNNPSIYESLKIK